jgi:hypothetical protein
MDILGWIDKAQEYEPLIKTGIAALGTYASYEDQKKKNKMQQAAYHDYMQQVDAAGQEARAAIDINYTPMTVSGVPQTKADVTDFTAVAARGGLMSIPNKQRKRYATGPDEVDVMEFDEEVITPEGFKMETGVDVTGEQVRAPGSASPREGAWNVWNSGAINQEIYEFDFEIFFDSGDWMDMLKGDVPMQGLQGNTMMASADPVLQDEYDKYVFELQEIQPDATPMSIEEFRRQILAGHANGGIIGLRHGGRPGYNIGVGPIDQVFMTDEQASTGNPGDAEMYSEDIYEMKIKPIEDKLAYIQSLSPEAQEALADEVESLMLELQNIENPPEFKTGGVAGLRKGYRFGPGPVVDQETMAESITLPDGGEEVVTDSMTEIEGQTAGGGDRGWRAQMLAEELAQEEYGKEFYDLSQDKQMEIYTIALDMIDSGGMAQGGRIGYSQGSWESEWEELYQNYKLKQIELGQEFVSKEEFIEQYQNNMATGGRIKKDNGGIMNLGGLEKDYRTTGGFVPIGEYEKKDDVPARLSKNEFVMTADAVRAAGGGSINKGAQLMYDTMKHLEAQPQAKRMTA